MALLLLLGTSVASMITIFFVGGPVVGGLAFTSMLLSITVGVLHYNAFGIDVVTRRVLVYSALTLLVLVAFVGIVAGLALGRADHARRRRVGLRSHACRSARLPHQGGRGRSRT